MFYHGETKPSFLMGGHTGGKLGSGSLTQRLAQALSSKKLGKKIEENQNCNHFHWYMQWFLICVKTSSTSQGTSKEISEIQVVISLFAVTERYHEERKWTGTAGGKNTVRWAGPQLPLGSSSGLSGILCRVQSTVPSLPISFLPLTCRPHRRMELIWLWTAVGRWRDRNDQPKLCHDLWFGGFYLSMVLVWFKWRDYME